MGGLVVVAGVCGHYWIANWVERGLLGGEVEAGFVDDRVDGIAATSIFRLTVGAVMDGAGLTRLLASHCRNVNNKAPAEAT